MKSATDIDRLFSFFDPQSADRYQELGGLHSRDDVRERWPLFRAVALGAGDEAVDAGSSADEAVAASPVHVPGDQAVMRAHIPAIAPEEADTLPNGATGVHVVAASGHQDIRAPAAGQETGRSLIGAAWLRSMVAQVPEEGVMNSSGKSRANAPDHEAPRPARPQPGPSAGTARPAEPVARQPAVGSAPARRAAPSGSGLQSLFGRLQQPEQAHKPSQPLSDGSLDAIFGRLERS